jgi:recombination protein RecR
MSKYPLPLLKLIALLRKLPGVGSRTAERFAFQLLSWPNHQLGELSEIISTIKEKIQSCPACGCLIDETGCSFCDLSKRDPKNLCILASAKDVFAIEETGTYHGLYHVLGGLLSPIEGRHPQNLNLEGLQKRIDTLQIQEVIIALDSTLEGDTTALYLKEHLKGISIRISRLAFGLPMGSSLDFVDGGTLSRAFTGRQGF